MTIFFSQSNVLIPVAGTSFPVTGSAPILTEYESLAWRFCRDWLTGQENFTLHTSGSTGTPKPIILTRQQMAASARMTGRALGLQPGDAALVNLNVQYIAGMMMLVRGLELGLNLTILEPSATPLAGLPTETTFDFQSYVPLQLQAMLEQTPGKIPILSRAKAILVGGAPVSADLENRLQAIAAPVYQTYGMTETVSHVALRRVNGPERRGLYSALDTIFFSTDPRNCLVIHAPQLNPEPVATNDVVELLSPTTFRWLGRADNVINSGGVKVLAEKVEAAVETLFARQKIGRRFFVTGLPHPQLGEAVTLVVEGETFAPATQTSVLQSIAATLARYEAPKSILFVPQFTETPTGKLDRIRTAGQLP